MSYTRFLAGLCGGLAMVAFASVANAQQTPTNASDAPYIVRRVPVPAEFAFGGVVSVNRHGEAVGSVGGSDGTRPSYYHRGELVVLDDLGGLNHYASAINDLGQIAGSSQAQPWWGWRAVRWDPDGTMQVMLPLTGDEHDNCWAKAMNGHGDVVGQSETSNGMARAFVWRQDDGTIDLGTFGGSYSQANDINDHGVVVGWADGHGARMAFTWREGVMTVLESSRTDGLGANAQAINNEGVIAGGIDGEAWGVTHAALWDENGEMHVLPGLADTISMANDINDRGTLVGTFDTEHGNRAFVYEGGTVRDLNEFAPAGSGWTFERAVSISENGKIVVTGRAGSHYASFILEPNTTRRFGLRR